MASRVLAAPLIDTLVPVRSNALRIPLQLVAGVALLALLAQVEVRLPIGPVPITGQTLGVLLVGAAYGWRLGGATLLAYLLAGGFGLAVFSGGGSGWHHFAGATAGYLVGFVVAASVVGYLAQRGWDRKPLTTALAMLVGNLVIYLFGLAWLSTIAPDFVTTLQWGLFPFIPGDIIKLVLAAGLLPTAWTLLGKKR
jgi:biotin transport system substrate-specific component